MASGFTWQEEIAFCCVADATMAAEFVRDNLWDEQRQRLRRSYRTGPSDVEGFADDYANLISGLLDLHAASGDTQWLKLSIKLQAVQDELFWDDTAGLTMLHTIQLQAT